MKAYLVLYGYCDEFNIDSVFLDKEKAEEYVKKDKRIPYSICDEFRIEEVELNPSANDKRIVRVSGYIDKNKEFHDYKIERIDREGMKSLKDFTGENIVLHRGVELNKRKIIGLEEVTFFDGTIEVTSCKDIESCDRYIKDIIMKKYTVAKGENLTIVE